MRRKGFTLAVFYGAIGAAFCIGAEIVAVRVVGALLLLGAGAMLALFATDES